MIEEKNWEKYVWAMWIPWPFVSASSAVCSRSVTRARSSKLTNEFQPENCGHRRGSSSDLWLSRTRIVTHSHDRFPSDIDTVSRLKIDPERLAGDRDLTYVRFGQSRKFVFAWDVAINHPTASVYTPRDDQKPNRRF